MTVCMNCLCRDHCLLIVLDPQDGRALYFDTSRDEEDPKDYTLIKGVLDNALTGYYFKGGHIKKPKCKSGKIIFGHKTDFWCIRQPKNSNLDAYYVLQYMEEFKQDETKLFEPTYFRDLVNAATPVKFRTEIYRIQQTLASVICQDVYRHQGMFHGGTPSRHDIANLLDLEHDTRS